jgi:signal transduction histidine kinase/DNA-binding response OmpR family regulator
MNKITARKKGTGLIAKIALVFLLFIVLSLVVCTIVTYRAQMRNYKKLKCEEIEEVSEYLAVFLQKDGQSFIDYVDYYKAHCKDLKIPYDFDEYQTAYDAFLDGMAEKYPGKTLYHDIFPEDISDDLKVLYYTYFHEYWILAFEQARAAFDLPYTYFLLMDDDTHYATYMIDGERIEDVGHEGIPDNPGFIYLGDNYYEDPAEKELLWTTWNTGEEQHRTFVWDNEWGNTYAYYYPLIINGQRIGLVAAEVDVKKVNEGILKSALVLDLEIALVLVVLSALLLLYIEKQYILKIKFLSGCLAKLDVNGKTETADEIDTKAFSSDEMGTLADGISGMLRDLDEHERKIEKAAKMKDDFLANMSHEIRTPMNAVIGMTDLIQREEVSDKVSNYVSQIKSSGNSLIAIINDILDFSKIESGRFDIVPGEYSPVEVLNSVVNMTLNKLSDKPVDLDIDMDPDIPAVLYGDSNRIKQILVNLTSNAVKFTNKGSITIHASFERNNEGGILKLSVEDTGIGIKPEDKDRIYDSFAQVDSKRNRNVEGTGLGLTICRRLADLMNGKLSMDSEYGLGSVFSVELPQKVVDQSPTSHIKDPDGIIALYMFSSELRDEAFERDAKRLSVFCEKAENSSDAEKLCLDILKRFPGRECFIFVDSDTAMSLSPEFFNSRADIKPVLVMDMASKLTLDLVGLTFATSPLYTANMAMIFNKEKEARAKNEETDTALDFTAPDANVLVVDDNIVNLTIAEGLLEPLRMNVTRAVSGKESVMLAGREKFDIIFMDHMMPEMDGVEAMHVIREKYPSYKNVPIIALTANAINEAKERLLAEGMDDFIPKPIELRLLLSKVKHWLPKEKIIQMTKEEAAVAALEHAERVSEDSDTLMIGDLDVQGALSMLGSETLFFNILKEYYRIMPEKEQSIREAWENKDWKTYTIEVHSLKSTSGQIGAKEVQKMAADLEAAGREENESFIDEHTEELLERYTAYAPVFKPFCEEDDEDDMSKPVADSETVKDAFSRLRSAADSLNLDEMENIVGKMSEYRYPDEMKELFESLKQAVQDIDADGCIAVLDKWESIM